MKIKSKRNLIIILGVLFLAVGSTLAYFKNSSVFNNVFNSGGYKTVAHEEFVSPDNWMPGDTTEKTVTVTNEGTNPVNVRICVEDYWITGNNTRLSNHSNTLNMDIALLNQDNTSDWSYADGCYYYNDELDPDDTTTSPISSVTFNPLYEGTIECSTDSTTGDITCESVDNSYDNAEYHLSLRIDTIQHEAIGEWGIGYSSGGRSFDTSSEAMASSGYNAFLKRAITNNKIVGQIGFMNNDDEIYLNNQESYESNKQTLIDLFGSDCTESSNILTCKTTDYMILLDNTEENNLNIYLENYKGNNRLSCSTINNSSECYEITTDTLMLVRSNSTDVFGKNISKYNIESIEIVDNKNIPADAIDSWDAGTLQNGSIMAWYKDEDSNNKYELYIGQDGGVVANPISDYVFSGYGYTKNISVSKLNVSNVRSMKRMFYYTGYNATTFTIEGLDTWNTSKVTDMSHMFEASGLNATTFNLEGLDNWDTSNVINMSKMFSSVGRNATTWTIGDLSNWDTSQVANMSYMFAYVGYNATTFTIEGLDNWDTSKVTNMSGMFSYVGYNATTFDIGDLSNWDTSNVTNMSVMFSAAGYNATTWNIGDLSNWDTSNITNMSSMFSAAGFKATTWTIGDLSNWDTSNVTDMNGMFSTAGFKATTFDIGDLGSWDTPKVTNMRNMFAGSGNNATTWTIGDLSNWDTSNVTDMNGMFSGTGYNATTWSIGDLSNWDTSNVTDMNGMFSGAGYNATTWSIGDLSNWDTSNVTDMNGMFSGAGYNATTWSIGDLSNWDTSQVTNMRNMFAGSGNNAATWNSIGTLKIYANNISYMFNSCPNAKVTLNIYSNPSSYSRAFTDTATVAGSGITVNYSSSTTNIDNIIATKSSNSNVVKGILLN